MAVKKKENQIKKMEKRAKAFDKTNPKLAANVRGKIAAVKGRKD